MKRVGSACRKRGVRGAGGSSSKRSLRATGSEFGVRGDTYTCVGHCVVLPW